MSEMKVKIDITRKSVMEYVNSDYPVPESEYPELIRGDIKTILTRAGFQEITMDDITVIVHD
ncbi:hypothetical protein [Xenorhabdus miraniensis]|uniref:Uncharacterized protein n=1 Tax=Xenorhabdus miraniensis TaxID=351674 RepID=A0A2D0JJP4_9GAMM|nr:hypothetical protein [Xenorhabdus miraniensis]PHM46545.1 hypothetical protein Xmir_04110 [Xenorhabdus miraniensis]